MEATRRTLRAGRSRWFLQRFRSPVSGLYNRGRDRFGERDVFSVLYLATAPEVSLGEKQRHLTSSKLLQMRNQVLSEFRVRLRVVYDLSKPEDLGIAAEDLTADYEYSLPQSLAATLRERGAEAFIVPSATLLGANLVVFPDRLRDASNLEVLGSRRTRLYVELAPTDPDSEALRQNATK